MNLNWNSPAFDRQVDYHNNFERTHPSSDKHPILKHSGGISYAGKLNQMKQEPLKPLISANSLKGRVAQELPESQKKSSGLSVKKAILIAAVILLGVGAAAYSPLTGYAACRSYYHDRSGPLEPVDQFLCQNEAAGRFFERNFGKSIDFGKLSPSLLKDYDFIMNAIIYKHYDIIDFLGDEIKKDPEKLLAILSSARWEKNRHGEKGDNFYNDKIDLLDSIPYTTNQEFCSRIVEIYPKKHLLSLYNKLGKDLKDLKDLKNDKEILIKLFSRDPLLSVFNNLDKKLQADEDIVAALIKHVDPKFLIQKCTEFKDSEKVALAAYARDYKAYEAEWRCLFSDQVQKSEKFKESITKVRCPVSDIPCEMDLENNDLRVKRFYNLNPCPVSLT